MRLAPYVVAPAPVPVALLDATGRAWSAHDGGEVGIGEHPFAFYIHHDYVAPLLTSGWGRGVWWNAQLITWEPTPGLLVRVLPHAGAPASFSDRLIGVGLWAEYLRFHGVSLAAAPHKAPASMGSASWRLLRRSLLEDLWYAVPRAQLPPVAAVIGGRVEMGWTAPGPYEGSFELWDISAAYARTLAALPYGGVWRRLDRQTARGLDLQAVVAAGTPCFIRARVHLGGSHAEHLQRPDRAVRQVRSEHGGSPDVLRTMRQDRESRTFLGPLPRRPRGRRIYRDAAEARTNPLAAAAVWYPRNGRMQGTWTADELVAALDAGCRAEIVEGWLHFADRDARPFAGWWDRIVELRSFDGYPGTLGKITGNALLGMFAVDAGRRREQWWTNGKIERRKLRREPVRPRAFDLFETVAGRVRARLYAEALRPGADHVICAHTDSVWTDTEWRPGWERTATSADGATTHGGSTPSTASTEPGGSTSSAPGARAQSRKPGQLDWRLSDTAEVIDLIDPQHYAWRRPGDPEVRYTMAGSPDVDAAAEFDARWLAEFGPNGPQRRTTAYDHVAETERSTRRRKVDA